MTLGFMFLLQPAVHRYVFSLALNPVDGAELLSDGTSSDSVPLRTRTRAAGRRRGGAVTLVWTEASPRPQTETQTTTDSAPFR